VGWYGNGVDADYFSPGRSYDNPYPGGSKAIVFTGAMDDWPNVDALALATLRPWLACAGSAASGRWRAPLRAAGRRFVEEERNWPRSVADYRAIYGRALGREI